jgi:hypothetical protein
MIMTLKPRCYSSMEDISRLPIFTSNLTNICILGRVVESENKIVPVHV